jgi:galactose mutarotase-like enzyme
MTSLLSPVTLRTPGSQLSLVPGRGAIITRWVAGGRERLYLDESTLADPTKNVRGGVPLLFPSPGKLDEGRFTHAGKSGAMKQHGFARDLPWTVTVQTESSISLSVSATDATRAMFPWEFAAKLEVVLSDARVRLAVAVTNAGQSPMPFGFGIHPYFTVRDKARARISTAATRAFDNVRREIVPFHGFTLGEGEVDMHLLDHGSSESTLTADDGRVTVRASPEFGRWVVWTLPGKEFVCLEPWTSPGNALNTGEGLITLAPGEERDLWLELEAG